MPNPPPPAASVLLLAACQDSQLAREEGLNGIFTRTIKFALDGLSQSGNYFAGNYRNFIYELTNLIGAPAQTPNLYPVGAENRPFLDQAPFYV